MVERVKAYIRENVSRESLEVTRGVLTAILEGFGPEEVEPEDLLQAVLAPWSEYGGWYEVTEPR